MPSIDFVETKKFPKIFIDYLKGNVFLRSRAKPLNKPPSDEELNAILKTADFSKLNELSRLSTPKPARSFKDPLLVSYAKKPAFVSASLKPSFLLGATHNLLKIISVVKISAKLNESANDYEFIPLLWLEDDSTDNLDASEITIHNVEGELKTFFCSSSTSKIDREAIAEKKFDKEIILITRKLLAQIGIDDNSVRATILNASRPNQYWTNAFIHFCNYVFGERRPAFIKMSEARKAGFFNHLVENEILNRRSTQLLAEKNASEMTEEGYEIKTKSESVNLKTKLNNLILPFQSNKSDLTSHIPNAMLEQIFQECVAPSAARVVSPSELSHSLLLKELYSFFGVAQPALTPRISATCLNAESRKIIKNAESDFKSLIKNPEAITDENSKKALNFILPGGAYQERIISSLNVLKEYNFDAEKLIDSTPSRLFYDRHYLLELTP